MNLFQIKCWPSTSANASICRPSLGVTLSTILAVFALLLMGGAVATAQVETGQIAGTVVDQSGAIIPGATVTIRNLSTNAERSTVTSASGGYVVNDLEPATYQITVSSGSFKPFTAKAEVTVGSHVTVDAKLSVSTATTEVEVIGEGGATVNTQTQELSQVVDTQQLAQLPSLTRNPYDFVTLSGNVSNGDNTGNNMSSGQNLTNRGVGFAINGQRESGTEILLDGVENLSVFQCGRRRRYSRRLGPGIQHHHQQLLGRVWPRIGRRSQRHHQGRHQRHPRQRVGVQPPLGLHRQHLRQRREAQQPKGAYTRNQFGYSAGGPIMKNKLFIFESTEWTRVRSSAVRD